MEKTFPTFQDIYNEKITKISIQPQDRELFKQLNSNLPILLKDCYDTDWLKRMCGRLRSSEKYGSDNLLYLEYSSLDSFIAMTAVTDWRETLATGKVVFLFDEQEKQEKYPLIKEKFGEIQPLAVGEITTLIRTKKLFGYSGNSFFNMIMDTHPCLLTLGTPGLSAYNVSYEKIYRYEILHQKDYEAWGYKLKYYEGMIYTPEEIKTLFSLPYSSERAFSGDKELEKKLKNDIVELALYAANNDFPIPHDEDGNPMVPVKWLKPDLPEGEKLYE